MYPPIFGHYGGFERNTQAEESGIKKLHVALGKKDFLLKTWRFADGDKRTCDNFLVYVRHWVYSDYFHIIAIITPNAHANADKLIHGIIEQAEVFHANGLPDLQKIPYFDETYVL
ncbi:type II toxin-antitoxin system YafO family toxin [Gallibacterium anatis]|uniref:type II toxin-antitoxin system YafO family toxin n=1 Tax=Gallibacterium anatis TaxID=750 RepID=UPI0018AF5A3C|nr:type II toxin-antitoxin system YafO family toxin [Gallibacterium anatis]WIM83060.1 type II toxin-antitoxin system YafO family toxin [Gallibacterium anatis]